MATPNITTDAPKSKRCTKCGEVKDAVGFSSVRGRLDSWCKRCKSVASAEYFQRHKKERYEYDRMRRKKDGDLKRAYHRQYYKKTFRKSVRDCERCGAAFEVKRSKGRFCSDTCRFWSQVNIAGEGGCWLWTARVGRFGYGVFGVNSRQAYTHRHSWELHFGPILGGLSVLHKCDVPRCVNPAHLFLGTQGDNSKDMWAKGRGKKVNAPRGEKSHLAKLTIAAVKEIRSSDCTANELARRYGVGGRTIRDIRNKRTWRHV